jgi:cardiolipin synthase
LLIGAIVLAVGLLIAQDQETLRIRSPLSADDPRFPPYLANLLGHRLTSNDSYVVRTDGEQAFPAMLASIEHAKTRIALETYIYEAGDVGKQFTDALEAAAKRGVRVRIVLDSLGSKKMADEDVDASRRGGRGNQMGKPDRQFPSRGGELSYAPQSARGGRRRRVHRWNGHRRSVAAR